VTEVATSAGGRLRAAREAAGLSVDAVAQQLKLAPRQVTALEEDDWQGLPGRTFIRGFARNYARFVRLDPEAVLALLPAPETAPALERPALRTSTRPMGEIPAEREAKASAWRWLAPLAIVAIVAAVAYYGLSPRASLHLPASLSLPGMTTSTDTKPTARPAADTPPPATPAPANASPSSTSTLALTPKVVDGTPAAPPAGSDAQGANAPAPVTPEAPGTSSATTSGAAPSVTATTPSSASAAAEAPLVLTFRGTSWAEVKDANGHVVLQMTGGAGMTQTVNATPPLELALGNAPAVGVTFRGQPLDLSAYTRGSVARVGLK
jgi:cytoskeleton protein RodZ